MTARDVLVTAAIACGTSFAAVASFLAYARRRRLLDVPNERSSHSTPTPRSGGLGIVVAVLVTIVLRSGDFAEGWEPVIAFAIAALVGFLDDVAPMRPLLKFVLLLGAAHFGLQQVLHVVHAVPFVGGLEFPMFAAILATWTCLALYPNAFNFMDGIDGIAALTVVVSAAVFAVAGVEHGDGVLAAWGALLAGSALGFLPWNFPKARIFMGDAGSLPLGLLLVWCSVRANWSGALPFPASILLLGPFLFDVAFTLVRRAIERKVIGEAHKEHLYQRLSRVWGSHAKVSLLYAGFSAATGALALSYASMPELGKLLSLALPLAAMLGFAALVLRAEREKGRRTER
jgi:Fuc2NAc and GlcNAc transferase